MPRPKQNNNNLIRKYTLQYPKEFCIGHNNTLYCNICHTIVDFKKKFNVDAHRKTKGHVVSQSATPLQTFLSTTDVQFTAMVVEAFLSADIPLEKLQNKKLKELFVFMKHKLPSESNARNYVHQVATQINKKIQNKLENKLVFILFDEAEILGNKYCNVMCGCLEHPREIWLINSVAIKSSANSTLVVNIIDDSLEKFNINHDSFVMLISDAATYMKKAGEVYKSRNRCFLHAKCLAHLIHNCSIRIRAEYENIDKVIGSLKALTIKNKQRQNLFYEIGSPPSVILTRWTSWLRAAMYYCDNLPAVKRIVSNITSDGILISRAKAALQETNLVHDLVVVKECYEYLIQILDNLEQSKYNIWTAYENIKNINLKYDPLGLKSYISQRLADNDIKAICEFENEHLAPTIYASLRKCPPTSIAVERSFSMLKKILAVGRNFDVKNVPNYVCIYYNSKVIETNDDSVQEEHV